VWRRLGLPHADLFATPTGAVLYWGFFAIGEWTTRVLPGVPSMREYLEYRHRLIDAVVEALGPDPLVELGAGLTRRAVTWAADHGVRAVEIDLPQMAAIKREALARAPIDLQRRLTGCHQVLDADVLADDFVDRFVAAVGPGGRPVVVAEGVLSYFDPDDRAELLRRVAEGLRRVGGGALVCDVHTKTAQAEVGVAAHALRTAIRGVTRRKRALDPYVDAEALHAAFAKAGFAESTIVEASAHLARQPRLAQVGSPAHVVLARV
jgi:O-methyltransferase involved in polyketide biosynthesis